MSKYQEVESSLLAFDSKNKENFKKQLLKIQKAGVKYIHYDVMDNKFVPNTAFGTEHLKRLFLMGFKSNVHLMVKKPKKYIKEFLNYPCNCITFHAEAVSKMFIKSLLKRIKKANVKCGLAFRPQTSLNDYKKLIKYCDYVTIMGVNPGFGGQKFMELETMNNLKVINEIKNDINQKLIIQLDGGVTTDVVKMTYKLVDHYISGSFLIKLEKPEEFIKLVKEI